MLGVLEELGRRTMSKGEFTAKETRYASRIIESMAQYPDERGDMVLDLLQRHYPAKGISLMHWLEPEIVRLAGQMRLQAAIPILVEHLHSDEDSLIDAAETALMKIGTDAVVEAIADDWPDSSEDFRGSAADVWKVSIPICASRTAWIFLNLKTIWRNGSRSRSRLIVALCVRGDRASSRILHDRGRGLEPEHFDLLYHLVTSATIMEIRFPDYERRYQQAQECNWGWTDYQRPRLSDAFGPIRLGRWRPAMGRGRPRGCSSAEAAVTLAVTHFVSSGSQNTTS